LDRINEFKDRAARRLKPIFEKDLNELSAELIDQLERLRQLEKQMLKAARKESSEPETIGNPERYRPALGDLPQRCAPRYSSAALNAARTLPRNNTAPLKPEG
jgi:hypothetical protein